ncbi:MAG: DUF4296 domain-containing protein [Rhodothermales bacterium]|nr:DUF4296 domain-containing protein [Rhodothermales bacterium]
MNEPRCRRAALLPAVLLAALLPACSALISDAPPVPDSTMVDVLIELHLGQARQARYGDLTPARRDSILALHGLDRPRFDEAMAYYADHPEELGLLYREALDRLQEERPHQPLGLRPDPPDSSTARMLD